MGLETNKVKYKRSWRLLRLKELCTRISDGTHFTPEYKASGVAFISVKDIYDGKVNFNKCKYISTEAHLELIKRCKPEKDDVLITKSGTIGRMALVPDKPEFSLFVSVALLKNKKEFINSKFLKYCLENFLNHINIAQDIKGGLLKNFHLEDIRETIIPEVPLPEQLAIVSKIEELFSELDNGIALLKTAQQQLKVYRQSLLKWAFEGKFTNKNVKEGELPKGWKLVRMGDVCEKIQDGSHFSPQVQYDEPGENRFKYITAKNIRNNYMDFRKVIYVDKEYHDSIYGRCNPEFGDVLLTKDGINTGEVTLNTLYEPFSLLSSVCLFKTKKKDLISSYLKYFIQSPFGNKAILDSMTGTAIKRIVLRKIKDAKIILPPLSEQQLIVDELESKLTVCDKIKETITQSLQQAETLRQSILKKAFEGKLIKTKP